MKKKEDIMGDDSILDDVNVKRKDLRLICITCLILAFIIEVIRNTNIDEYIGNFIIPFGLMLAGYLYLINKIKLEKNNKAYMLMVPIILALLSEIIIDIDISNKILNIIILPILIAIFMFLLINNHFKMSKESLSWIFKLFPFGMLKNMSYVNKSFNFTKHHKTNKVLNILCGCLIGIPIALVMLSLLSKADKYFSEFVGAIFDLLPKIFNIEFIRSNLLAILLIFIVFFGIFINLLKNKDTKYETIPTHNVNTTIASTILIIINAVFILFLLSEISKLTINFLQLPIEYTYAEYAREGFFQLLVVTSINFVIILYYLYYTEVVKRDSFIKQMLLLLIGFSIVLICNSYYRMFLYVSQYGYTVLRLQVILFLAMELILFIILIKKIIWGLKHKDANLFSVIILSSYMVNIYYCTTAFANLLNNI